MAGTAARPTIKKRHQPPRSTIFYRILARRANRSYFTLISSTSKIGVAVCEVARPLEAPIALGR
jgi:hypothetical protein